MKVESVLDCAKRRPPSRPPATHAALIAIVLNLPRRSLPPSLVYLSLAGLPVGWQDGRDRGVVRGGVGDSLINSHCPHTFRATRRRAEAVNRTAAVDRKERVQPTAIHARARTNFLRFSLPGNLDNGSHSV